jgi:hypothetical protein
MAAFYLMNTYGSSLEESAALLKSLLAFRVHPRWSAALLGLSLRQRAMGEEPRRPHSEFVDLRVNAQKRAVEAVKAQSLSRRPEISDRENATSNRNLLKN